MMKWRGAEGVKLSAPQKSVPCSQAGTNNARHTADDGVARVGRAAVLCPDARHERPHTLEDGGDGADRFHDRFLELRLDLPLELHDVVGDFPDRIDRTPDNLDLFIDILGDALH